MQEEALKRYATQETLLVQQQDRLLNLRLSEDVDQETFARKHTELAVLSGRGRRADAGPLHSGGAARSWSFLLADQQRQHFGQFLLTVRL